MKMRQNLLIGAGLIILIFFVVSLFQSQPEVLTDSSKNSYIELTRKDAVLNYQRNDVFVIKNETENPGTYRVIGHPSSSGVNFQHFGGDLPRDVIVPFDKIAESMFAMVNFRVVTKMSTDIDTIYKTDFSERKALFKNAAEFEGRRYLNKDKQPTDWFTKIEDSAVIFIPLALIPFLILLFHDLILYFTNTKRFSKTYFAIQFFFLLNAVLFFYNMTMFGNFGASKLTGFIKFNLLIFPIYIIYQYLLKNILQDEKEYKKAIIFFGICILIAYLSTMLVRFFDQWIFDSDGYTMLAERAIQFEVGFLFSFVLGNFLNNLRKDFLSHRRRSKELDVTKSKVLASQAELNTIQASVNPHFLYNSLNSIASLAKSDPEKTEAMSLALSKFYKYNTNRGQNPASSIAEEIEMITNYLEIEKIRFGDRLQYQIHIDDQAKSRQVPHFVFQPLVENAIKYGYNEASETIQIKVDIKEVNNKTEIKIFDQGKSFTEDLSSGYGLKSVMKKLELFFPNSHSIDFINVPEKHVFITIEHQS